MTADNSVSSAPLAASPAADSAGSALLAANPAQLVVDGVRTCLSLAATWHAWDGRPLARTNEGRPNTWTPHKALRRITDHLHEVEALLAGAEAVPDQWHGRSVTLDADWARFTESDFDEAQSRLRRLARCYLLRYSSAGLAAWDSARGDSWTLRTIAEHVAEVSYYAEQVGRLA